MDATLPADRRSTGVDRNLLWAAVVPLALFLLASPDFFFDPPGFVDSFLYVGYFLHYPEHLHWFDCYYKVSRLPWVLPGHACYAAFGPVWGSIVLQLGAISFGVACTYLALRDSLGSRVAVLASIMLGACTWFHGSGGWNYHMTIATGYFLLTVAFVNRAAAGPRPTRWYVASGAVFGLALHTHPFMAVTAPGLFLHAILVGRMSGNRLRAVDVLAGVAGIGACTAALAAVHRATGGDWLFFLPQIRFMQFLAEGNTWHRTGYEWLGQAKWLALPAATLLVCLLTRLTRRGNGARGEGDSPVAVSYRAQLALAAAGCCYYQFVQGQTVLDYSYMAACLLGPTILALAACVPPWLPGTTWWARLVPAPAALIAFCLPLFGAPARELAAWLNAAYRAWPSLETAPVLLPLAADLAGVACLALARRPVVMVAGLLLLGLANAAGVPADAPGGYAVHGRALRRDIFGLIIQVDRCTTRIDPSLVGIQYWFDAAEKVALPGEVELGPVFSSYVATRGWAPNLLGRRLVPDVAAIESVDLADVRPLALLCASAHVDGYVRQLEERSRQLGKPLGEVSRNRFVQGPFDVTMTLFGWEVPRGRDR